MYFLNRDEILDMWVIHLWIVMDPFVTPITSFIWAWLEFAILWFFLSFFDTLVQLEIVLQPVLTDFTEEVKEYTQMVHERLTNRVLLVHRYQI